MIRNALLASAFFAAGCSAQAGNYLIEAAPAPSAPSALSSSARVFLAPFSDQRRSREIYKGRAVYEDVSVDAAGRTLLAKAWQALPDGDLSYLWHRQLADALQQAGYNLSAAAEPLNDAQALQQAKDAGASFLIQGKIKKLGITKHGADGLFGTNFTGTNYTFYSSHELRVRSVDSGGDTLKASVDFEKVFYNAQRLGASDRDTFPQYFVRALPEAGRHLADDPKLRVVAGLPTCTPTPTATLTPEPTRKGSPAPTPQAGLPTLTPTPDTSPYWYNPHTGKRVDPAWNFDPADGTPKKDFILKSR